MPQVNSSSWLFVSMKFFFVFFMIFNLFYYIFTSHSLKKLILLSFYSFKNLI